MKFHLSSIAQYPIFIRLGIFIMALLLLWLPIAVPVYLLVSDPNLITILTITVLYAEFIFLLRFWGKHVYRTTQILRHYGLARTRKNGFELLSGLITGIIIVLSLFGLEGLLGWLIWQQPAIFLPKLILEGLIVGLGYGFAEELLFRGWLLYELERDYPPGVAVWANAILFALLHFIKPLPDIIHSLPQFAGLLLLGLTLVWAKRYRQNRLGLPMGLHAGLIWGYYIINVGQLVQFSGQVPDWITGINRNPLAGVMGLFFLGVLALWVKQRSLLRMY